MSGLDGCVRHLRMVLAAACALIGAAAGAGGAGSAADARRSGFDFMSPTTQSMQRDDTANPAWLWRIDGEQRFAADCARCHDAGRMVGVAARHPAFDATRGRPISLGGRIDACWREHVGADPLGPEHPVRLALETFVANASRGLPIAPPTDPRLDPWRERGGRLYLQRMGQLDLACTHCHDRAAGRRLGGSVIPQGHPTGYPIYRLEWQTVGSLQRRIRGCLAGVRAEPFADDSDEYLALEVFLAHRAAGLPIETPAVRP
jgi:sulfur-oxidizing protein SoxA